MDRRRTKDGEGSRQEGKEAGRWTSGRASKAPCYNTSAALTACTTAGGAMAGVLRCDHSFRTCRESKATLQKGRASGTGRRGTTDGSRRRHETFQLVTYDHMGLKLPRVLLQIGDGLRHKRCSLTKALSLAPLPLEAQSMHFHETVAQPLPQECGPSETPPDPSQQQTCGLHCRGLRHYGVQCDAPALCNVGSLWLRGSAWGAYGTGIPCRLSREMARRGQGAEGLCLGEVWWVWGPSPTGPRQ